MMVFNAIFFALATIAALTGYFPIISESPPVTTFHDFLQELSSDFRKDPIWNMTLLT
jgi:hypothetical protein